MPVPVSRNAPCGKSFSRNSHSAISATVRRIRAVLMTAFAMIAGMVPLAVGSVEAGEQTAPLGVAVIGGLSAATIATLLVLPCTYAIVQSRASRKSSSLDPADPASAHYEVSHT